MEVLLLDTTEKEGEDNELYHYCSQHPSSASAWRGLRGVLAAAVGTTTSVCGEPLRSVRFVSSNNFTTNDTHRIDGSEADGGAGVAGFVNLAEVLFVLVFPAAASVPLSVVRVRRLWWNSHSSPPDQ
ncbi:hypothetical protein PybrP1_000920 [[Pythium] brassicae (nom. inval.)]|nr:hypothetical protein PybrP1_000920 [[Pythium] brassicae (nom. inval.)]